MSTDTNSDVAPETLIVNNEMVLSLQRAMLNAPRDIQCVCDGLNNVLKYENWRDRLCPNTGRRFTFSADEFICFITEPFPVGLGADVPLVRKLIEDDRDTLLLFETAIDRGQGGLRPGQERAEDGTFIRNRDNITVADTATEDTPKPVSKGPDQRGTSTSYSVRRLSKAAESEGQEGGPATDALNDYLAGEVSLNRAMIAAGLRNPPRTAYEECQRLYQHKLSAAEREEFLAWTRTIGSKKNQKSRVCG